MKTYHLVQNTHTGGLNWTLEFDMAGDAMAIAYVEKILKQSSNTPHSCMGATLFKVDGHTADVAIADYTLNRPEFNTISVTKR